MNYKHLSLNLVFFLLLAFPTLQLGPAAQQEVGAVTFLPEQLLEVSGVSESWWAAVQEEISVDILPTEPDWYVNGEHQSANLGLSVGTAGDVNGDGYADVIIGSPNFNGGLTNQGKVYVYHGSNQGLSTTPDWTIEGGQINAELGISVGTAGDVNDDGYSDVIIGARRYYDIPEEMYEGAAFVYHGSETGLSPTANWSAEGNAYNVWFGISVGTAGDVNNDGYSDVIVGVANTVFSTECANKALVYHGSGTGLSTTADWTEVLEQTGACFGVSVGTAGDVNNDGYSDVIIGALYYDNGESDEGGAFVYHGSEAGLSATPNWSAEGDQIEAYFGISVGTAGDVNGDGYSDVIVGASYYDNGQTDEGRAFVYHGSGAGLSTTANWDAEGDQEYAYFGASVGTAGNVNNDSYSEALVGAHWYDNPNKSEGRAFLFAGSAGGLSTSADWITESNQSYAYYGCSLGTAGDVNGNGFSDVIVGAYAYYYDQENQGRAYVYYDLMGYRSFLPMVRR
jgi:hypothetical protein